MSEHLAAAAAALDAPEVIVMRSAQAKAAATGSSVDELLAAWAGGAPVAAPAAAAAPASTTSAVETPIVEAPAAAPAVAGEPAPAAHIQTPAAPLTVEIEEEPAEPVPLKRRVRVAGRVGAWSGAMLGFAGLLAASGWLLPKATVIGEAGAFRPAVEVTAGSVVIGIVAISGLFGMVVAAVSRQVASWHGPGMALAGRGRGSIVLGGVLGIVLGSVAGGIVSSVFGEELAIGIIGLPLVPLAFVLLLGGALLGYVTAAVVQLLGVPLRVSDEESEEVIVVRKRLVSAAGIPVTGLAILILLVIPFALVLIRTGKQVAPIVGILAAAGVITFAGLSASRPGMRISLGEFGMAAAGIVVLVVMIVAVTLAQGGGDPFGAGGEETEAGAETGAETSTTVVVSTTTP